MMIIPGFLIAALTFPGVIFHELSHQLFCRLLRVPVYEVVYFQPRNPTGYVAHERSEKPWTNFLIAIGPFIVNTLIGSLMLVPVAVQAGEFDLLDSGSALWAFHNIVLLICLWLGFSILMHAFPSSGDARTLVDTVLKNNEVGFVTKVLVAPFVGLMYLGAVGSMFWLDAGYAVAVTALLPKLLALAL